MEIADHERQLWRRRLAEHPLVHGQRPRVIALADFHPRQTGHRIRMIGKGECRALEFPPGVAEPPLLQQQIPELRVVPRLPFGVVRARSLGGHAHVLERAVEVALHLERVGHARVRSRPGP